MTAPRMELRRAPEPAPVEPGQFYGRLKLYQDAPCAWNVALYKNTLWARTAGQDWYALCDLDWFGQVPTCMESGT